MIYVMGLDGTIIATSVSNINQGESGASEIILLAPFPSYYIVRVKVKLPNGLILPASLAEPEATDFTMTLIDTLENFSHVTAPDGTQIGYNAWKIAVLYPITQNFGNVKISFVLTGTNGVTKTSPEVDLTINKGTPLIDGELPTPEDIEGIINYLALAGMYATNAATAADEAISAKDEAISAKDEAVATKEAIGRMLDGFNDELNYLGSEVVTLNAEKADKTEVSALETRVNLIEGALIEFDTDNSTEYKKPVPLTSAHTAFINSIKGKTVGGVGVNKFDPYLFSRVFQNFEVSADGTINGDAYWTADDQQPLADIYLSTGTWTIGSSGANALPVFFSPYHNYNLSNGGQTITLSEPTNVSVYYTQYWSEDFVRYSFKVMLKKGSTELPYEPYQYAPTVVTEVKSYGDNLITPYIGLPATQHGITAYLDDMGYICFEGVAVTAYETQYLSFIVTEIDSIPLKAGRMHFSLFGEWSGTNPDGTYSPVTAFLKTDGNSITLSTINSGDMPYQEARKTTQDAKGTVTIVLTIHNGTEVKGRVGVMLVREYHTPQYHKPLPRPFATFKIPDGILALPDYGLSMPDGSSPNEVDFDNKLYYHRCTKQGDSIVLVNDDPTSISAFLTGSGYRSIQVQGGGEIEFVNAYDEPVPSEVTFLLAP